MSTGYIHAVHVNLEQDNLSNFDVNRTCLVILSHFTNQIQELQQFYFNT